jgi:hypothetical protein
MSEAVPNRFGGPKALAVMDAARGRWATFGTIVVDSGVAGQSVKWYLGEMTKAGLMRRAENATDNRGKYVYRLSGT